MVPAGAVRGSGMIVFCGIPPLPQRTRQGWGTRLLILYGLRTTTFAERIRL